LQQTNNLYWYEYLPEQKSIYIQINAFVHKKDEPFDAFCQRLFKAYDGNKAERLNYFVKLSSVDFKENRDPVLERIFNYDSNESIRPEFASKLAEAYQLEGSEGLKNTYSQIKTNYVECGFNIKNLSILNTHT